jgi:mannose/fructose-specific phosphotransferase system component IIA
MAKRKLIIASHGGYAGGALEAAEMISGGAGYEVSVFCMRPGEAPLDFASALEGEISGNPEKEFVLFADLFGASICNALYPLARFPNVKLFTDFNLRLLIEVMADYREPLNREDMDAIAAGNRECLRALYFEKPGGEPEDF